MHISGACHYLHPEGGYYLIYSYPGCFFQRPDGKYCVVFSDLNNLAAFGSSFDQALANAVNLLAGYIYNLILKKEQIPEPSDIQTLRPYVGDEYSRAFFQTVNVDVDEYAKYYYNSSTEMTVTLPRWLEEYARREKIDISAVIRAYLTDRYNKQHTM